MAKLDPDNWKSAKDVMDERAAAALKRKRDDEMDEGSADTGALEGIELEPPKVMQDADNPKAKKRKVEGQTANPTKNTPVAEETEEELKHRKAMKKAEKREKKQAKKTKAKEKQERQKAKKRETEQLTSTQGSESKKASDELRLKEPINLGELTSSQVEAMDDGASSAPSSEADQSEVFSPHHESGTSSISSIQPASVEEPAKQERRESLPRLPPLSTDTNPSHTPRERLQAAISQLRADRKADGTDGSAPKNRQELLEQRRRKEEARKAAKKEQKRREKEEEALRQDEELERRFSPGGSGSLLASPRSPMIGDGGSPTSNASNNNFSFGRIAFEDGTQFDPSISGGAFEDPKKKGPRDTAAELKAAQAKKARLAGLDEEKRLNIEEKDMWLNAKRRAHGDHVRDDTSLLKKALKRQQGQKRKSEREWTDRLQGVQKAQEARQKKRNDNLAKRKEEKHSSGGGGGKKVRRPGFEGSFKGRTGGKRKA